jgi:site-specific DNA recombinase
VTRTPRVAGIYCRLSYAPDGSLEKVERQEADCRQLADRLAWPVSEAHIFCDNSRSAWQRNRRRPGWDAMLAAIERREIDSIIVYHGDRLIRQPYDLEKLIGIADSKGVRLASVSGTRDLDNPDDRYILRIEAAGSCRASDDTSRRVRRGWAARAQQGLPVGGGKRAFGFEADGITRREAECEILAEAVERLLAGQFQGAVIRWLNAVSTTTTNGTWTATRVREWSGRGGDEVADEIRSRMARSEPPTEISKDLNQRGVRCPVRAQWTTKALRNLVLSPRIAGLVDHEGTLYEAVWKPVIDVETWEAVKALFAESAEEHPYGGRERKYLLSGVATCPSGHPVRTKPVGGRNRKDARLYYCAVKGCPTKVSRNIEHLDRYVEGRTVGRLNDPDFVRALYADPEGPDVEPQIAELERRKARVEEQLANLVDYPEIDPGLLARSLAGFDRKIRELRASRSATARQRLLERMAGISREDWAATPVDVRSATIAALWRVTILPATWRGPGFDADSVDLLPVEG